MTQAGGLGASQEIVDTAGIPRGWTAAVPPAAVDGFDILLGDAGWVLTPAANAAPSPPPIEDVKADACAQIDAACATVTAAGFAFGGNEFQSDPLSVTRIGLAATAAVAAIATGNGAPETCAGPMRRRGLLAGSTRPNGRATDADHAFLHQTAVSIGQARSSMRERLKELVSASPDAAVACSARSISPARMAGVKVATR